MSAKTVLNTMADLKNSMTIGLIVTAIFSSRTTKGGERIAREAEDKTMALHELMGQGRHDVVEPLLQRASP